jgi:hypothetical protein
MSGGGMVVSIVMLVIGIAWLALPYVRGVRAGHTIEREKLRERFTLAAAYERALLTVRDLDEDFQVGKLSQETYVRERERWLKHGAAQLEALEKAGGSPKKSRKSSPLPPAQRKPSVEVDDSVEQAIAAYIRARENSSHQ